MNDRESFSSTSSRTLTSLCPAKMLPSARRVSKRSPGWGPGSGSTIDHENRGPVPQTRPKTALSRAFVLLAESPPGIGAGISFDALLGLVRETSTSRLRIQASRFLHRCRVPMPPRSRLVMSCSLVRTVDLQGAPGFICAIPWTASTNSLFFCARCLAQGTALYRNLVAASKSTQMIRNAMFMRLQTAKCVLSYLLVTGLHLSDHGATMTLQR